MSTDFVSNWAHSLQQWAIPTVILDQAPESPWIHPVETFRPTGNLMVDTPSRHRALEALQNLVALSVLDVGCGGGRGTFGLTPPATHVVGVDHQQGMLDVYQDEARQLGVAVQTVLGDWPDVAANTPQCDVVICHHVFYNVQNIAPFVHALSSHAKKRVVVELPVQHPLATLSDLWLMFWDLERPSSPTAHDALAVVRHLGYDAQLELFEVAASQVDIMPTDVEHTRIRLCLPADRDAEIEAALRARPAQPRKLATIWWDV